MARYDDDEERPRRRRPRDDDEEERPPRAARGAPARRAGLVEQRLRARASDYEDEDDYEDDYEDEPPRAYARRRSYGGGYGGGGCAFQSLGLTLAFLAIFALLFLVARQFLSGGTFTIPQQIAQVAAPPTPTVIDRGGTILQIRKLSRLETQSFSAERVIEARVERGNALDLLLGERLLLIARGEVVAGVDLSKLRDSDVTISPDGKQISLRLPPSEIFSIRIDNANTRVYDKQSGIGTRLFGSENKDLETQARQGAEGEILKAACESQMTQRAADEARRSLEQFLKLAQFESVTVTAPAGACAAPAAPSSPTAPPAATP
jgi:hypothetical protein